MRNKWSVKTSLLVAFVLALILVQAAGAGKFHFNSVSFSLGSLQMNGVLQGLGNEVAEVILTGNGTVNAVCQNLGGQQASGRNPIRISVTQTNWFKTDTNGRALVEVTAEDPTLSYFTVAPTAKEAGCPNNNWSVVDIVEGSTNWTSAHVLVKDLAGIVQINKTYKCTTVFQNGVSVSVSCKES